MKLVVATKNMNKLTEIKDRFSSIDNLELLSVSDFEDFPDIIEDGNTFEENALIKARITSEFTKHAVLADDSGLEIDVLDGEPGVYSARYAGEDATDDDRNKIIIDKMKSIPDRLRKARFVCIIAIVLPDKREYISRGECEGIISLEIKGLYGFGYDPIFYLTAYGKTMAELPLSEKNRISHRARALDKSDHILREIISEKKE